MQVWWTMIRVPVGSVDTYCGVEREEGEGLQLTGSRTWPAGRQIGRSVQGFLRRCVQRSIRQSVVGGSEGHPRFRQGRTGSAVVGGMITPWE